MDGAHRAVVALAHRVEHRDDLVTANLTHDHAVRAHPQAHADEVCGCDCTDPFDIGLASLERDAVGVELWVAVDAELELRLHSDDPLLRRDLGGEGSKSRGLPGSGGSGDHDLLPRPDGRSEEAGHSRVDGAEADQVVKVDLHVAVTANRQDRPPTHPRGGEQTGAVRELKVQLGMARVELALGQAVSAPDLPHEIDQLGVGRRDRLGPLLGTVGVLDIDNVTAVRVNVDDPLIVQQRLKPTEPEDALQHRLCDELFLIGSQHGLVGCNAGTSVAFEVIVEQAPSEGGLVFRVEPPVAGPSRCSSSDRELLGHLGPKPSDERFVDTRRHAHAVTSSQDRDLIEERPDRSHQRRAAGAAFGSGQQRAGAGGVDRDGEGRRSCHRRTRVRGAVWTVADRYDRDVDLGLRLNRADEPTGVLDAGKIRAAGDENPVPRADPREGRGA